MGLPAQFVGVFPVIELLVSVTVPRSLSIPPGAAFAVLPDTVVLVRVAFAEDPWLNSPPACEPVPVARLLTMALLLMFKVLVLRIPAPAGTEPVAVFPLIVVLGIVVDPPAMLARPPPNELVFPLIVLEGSVRPPKLLIPPPVLPAELLAVVLLLSDALPPLDNPPPSWPAVLLINALLLRVTVPPSLLMPPPLLSAEFPATVALDNVSAPPLLSQMPPPLPFGGGPAECPLLTVTLLSVRFPWGGSTSKIRKLDAEDRVIVAPPPLSVIGVVITGKPLPSLSAVVSV